MSERRPLIAHVIHRFAMGGMENGLVNLINGMDRRFAHAIICLNGHSDFAKRLTHDDVTLYDIAKLPGKDLAHYGRLWRLLRRLRPAIVHTRNIGTIEAGVIARLGATRVVLHGEHGFDVDDLDGGNQRYRRLRRFSSPFIQNFICVSQQIRNWLRDGIGIEAAKLRQIYNGVDCKKFSTSQRDIAREKLRQLGVAAENLVGTVGRLETVKNPLGAVRGFSIACERDAQFKEQSALVLVGDGSLANQLATAVGEMNLSGRVHLLGKCDHVAQLLAGFDVFVQPSLNEGISNTILEAMASGVPVVASNVGGNPELVVDGSTGKLYEVDDVAALAEHLLNYYRNEELRVSHAAASTSRVQTQFSLERMITDYESIYARFC